MEKLIKEFLLNDRSLISDIVSKVYCSLCRNVIRMNKGNLIRCRRNYLKHSRIDIKGRGNQVLLGKNNHLVNSSIFIKGNNNTVILGDNNSLINCEIWVEDDGGSVIFGNDNKILGRTHLAETEGCTIKLGDGCLFSTNVVFRTGDSHSILSVETGERINPAKSITIGDRVWFGNDSKVLKGSEIQSDSIVATGAIVTKKFEEPNVVLAGNPASVVKHGVKWIAKRV